MDLGCDLVGRLSVPVISSDRDAVGRRDGDALHVKDAEHLVGSWVLVCGTVGVGVADNVRCPVWRDGDMVEDTLREANLVNVLEREIAGVDEGELLLVAEGVHLLDADIESVRVPELEAVLDATAVDVDVLVTEGEEDDD
jgi:hypothetical protein